MITKIVVCPCLELPHGEGKPNNMDQSVTPFPPRYGKALMITKRVISYPQDSFKTRIEFTATWQYKVPKDVSSESSKLALQLLPTNCVTCIDDVAYV